MQINLLDMIDTEGKRLHELVPLEFETISFQQGNFPILEKEPVDLVITNIGNKVLDLSGFCRLVVSIPCARCLDETSVELSFDIERQLDMKMSEADRLKDLDESAYLTGTDLDVDSLVYLEVLMRWPVRVLCREDCAGLCSRCGKRLNEGPCDCLQEALDPRMAVISDIFSKYKEV
jgi:uncharacterized protein